MKLLILSVGSRFSLVRHFKEETKLKVVCGDASPYAPALYAGDEAFLLPEISEEHYLQEVFSLCERQHVTAVLSLIDSEIHLLSQKENEFKKRGIALVLPKKEVVARCFDKRKMYDFLKEKQVPVVPTYKNLLEFQTAFEKKEVEFPVFVKPATGSASQEIKKIHDLPQLTSFLKGKKHMIIQPFVAGPEFGVDVYCDLETGEMIDYFMKEKVKMRSGETDKARSTQSQKIKGLIQRLLQAEDFTGPIDVDVFFHQGDYYISEVNPRFGGGYAFAEKLGAKFPAWIEKNLGGEINLPQQVTYPEDVKLMKYSEVQEYV